MIFGKDHRRRDRKTLAEYAGKVILIVNVASRCGFTPQYTGLEAIWNENRDKGFVILGFPCNQFSNQEPGTDEEIKTFCSTRFVVTFPLFSKIEVNGDNRPSALQLLKEKDPASAEDVKWNFTKFLIDRKGNVVKRFQATNTPRSAGARNSGAALGRGLNAPRREMILPATRLPASPPRRSKRGAVMTVDLRYSRRAPSTARRASSPITPARSCSIVNVASKCGFTPQYEGLEALWRAYRDSGLRRARLSLQSIRPIRSRATRPRSRLLLDDL